MRGLLAADARLSLTIHADERERSCVRAAQRGDAAAREQLLENFLPLVRSVARNYSRTAVLELEELVQEGVVGLLTALERYDPDLGPPFWAYASWWVRRMMQRLVADLTLPLVLSDRALRQLATVKHARHDLEQSHHWVPSSQEMADSTGYTHEQLDSLTCVELSPRSLDEPMQADDGAGGTLAELLADPHSGEGYYAVDQQLEADFLRQRPNDLGTRERLVLRARYGFDGPMRTLHEVGDELDVSAERVRQIQERALEKLRLACSSVLSDSSRSRVDQSRPEQERVLRET